MVTALVILIILGVILVIGAITVNFEDNENRCYPFFSGIGILFSVLIIGTVYSLSIPPIDVYRGNTTLEITYKDNIPVDSVVVYKNK